jgi:adenine-specific DNA-methyltransferase
MSESLPLVHAERLLERTEATRLRVAGDLDARHRARWGQFFTPAPVAAFLARLIDVPHGGHWRVLDPGAGIGSLSAAVVARAITSKVKCSIHLVAFEADAALIGPLEQTLRDCERAAARVALELTTEARPLDFLVWAADALGGSLFADPETFDACIMNPPYRKINTDSSHRAALERIGLRVTNLYPAFLAAAAALLRPEGQLSAITPRSFANGPYFLPFREFFLARMRLDHLHVYEKRGRVFSDADVLQENVIMRATRAQPTPNIVLSTSVGVDDAPTARTVPYSAVVDLADKRLFIHIPVDDSAKNVADYIALLPCTLGDLGITVSTGRVVDFRTRSNLVHDPDATDAPLIYPGHLRAGRVLWPLLDGRKPNGLAVNADTTGLLLPAEHYVLVKRFTAKEERRRVVAATFEPGDVGSPIVAFENHLNVFHHASHGIDVLLAKGLAVFLNTSVVDAYVRQFSGHTQINATDLRTLRYPSVDSLTRLGAAAADTWPCDQSAIDRLADAHIAALRTDGALLAA